MRLFCFTSIGFIYFQCSNYLFRSDPRKFSEYFQHLGSMKECCKLTHLGFGVKMLLKCKKVYFFGVRHSKVSRLKKLRGFPEDKSFNRRKVLIREFHKRLLKMIRENRKSIRELRFADH